MLKPICVKCRCFYRPEKNGICFTEGMPNGTYAPGESPRGLRDPSAWEPYKLWRGDLWKCPDCGAEIIVGCASSNFHEHYLPGFKEAAIATGADKLQVNDC